MPFRAGKCSLRYRLKQAGMTQTELAKRLNLSQQMISHYIHGRKVMSLEVAYNIAVILDCNVESLYSWEYRNGPE
jgi:transcriptional regulator with XRE-family HTH domain